MAGVNSKGFPFHRKDVSLAVRDKELLSTVEQSVGLITIERLITGEFTREFATGFLVGNGYFMTVYHILENKIDDITQDIARFMPDEEKWERWVQTHSSGEPNLLKVDAVTAFIEKEKSVSFQNFTKEMDDKDTVEFNRRLKDKWDQCYVVFPKANSSHPSSEEVVFFFDQCIPFADKESDVLILKISEKPDCTMPNSLILQEKYEKRDKMNLYGYLKHEEKEELYLDIYCLVYTDATKLENDVAKAKRNWEDKEKDTETHNHNYQKMNFTEEFQNCSASFNKENEKITLHTSETFVHGTSGSPILIIKRIGDARKPVVNGMYQRGFPSFYYEVEESIRMRKPLPSNKTHYNKFREVIHKENAVKPNHLFESGVTMEHIANILKASGKPNFLSLKNSIFSTRGPEAENIVQEQPPPEINAEEQEESNTITEPISQERSGIPEENTGEITEPNGQGRSGIHERNTGEITEPIGQERSGIHEEYTGEITEPIGQERSGIHEENTGEITEPIGQERSGIHEENTGEITEPIGQERSRIYEKNTGEITENNGQMRSGIHGENTGETRVSIAREMMPKETRKIPSCRKGNKCKMTKPLPLILFVLMYLLSITVAVIWIVTFNKHDATMTKEVEIVLSNYRFRLFDKMSVDKVTSTLQREYKFVPAWLIIAVTINFFFLLRSRNHILLIIFFIPLILPVVLCFIGFNTTSKDLIGTISMVANEDKLEQYRNNDTTKATFDRFMEMFVCCGINNTSRRTKHVSDGCCSTKQKDVSENFKTYSCCYIKAKEFHDTYGVLANVAIALIAAFQLMSFIIGLKFSKKQLFEKNPPYSLKPIPTKEHLAVRR